MFCSNCGKEIEEGAVFCKHCGAKAGEVQNQRKPASAGAAAQETSEAPVHQIENVKKSINKEGGRTRKKTGIIAAGIILLAAAAAAGFFAVQRANAAKAFSDKVTAFKNYCEDYQMGDLEADYKTLLEEAEHVVKEKERSAYSDTEGELEQFKEKLQEYTTKLEGYSGKREEYALIKDYPMTDEQKGRYTALLAELEKGFEENSLLSIEQSINNFDAFFKDWESEFRQMIENRKAEAEQAIASDILLEAERQMINAQLDNAGSFWDKGNYNEAMAEYESSASLLDGIKKSADYEIRVEQAEVSSFPEIKLYVTAYDIQSNHSVPVLESSLALKEMVQGSYSDVQVNKVSKLDQKENLNVCLVADVSGSMWEQMPLVQRSMTNFLDCLQYSVGDKAALITFDNLVKVNRDFTGDKNVLTGEINNMYVGNATALYDALYVAVCKASEAEGAKCVIAFTDGYDNVSMTSKDRVIEAARLYGVPVYLIGIGSWTDETSLQSICSSTGGDYWNVSDGSEMQAIYNSIYQKNKEMYLVEYTTSIQDINVPQNLYLSYNDGDAYMRCETEFEPSKLKASEEEYTDLVQDNGMANADVEDEVLRIRGIYNEIVQKRTNGQYMESAVKDGVTMYTENGEVQCIIAKKGVDGVPYARYYYFENGSLIFAYLEAGDSHRLYFNNGRLFRWRYASDAVNFSEADNHDNEDSEEFREWENLALDDIYNYGGVCRV
ncbi:VWA domain-containing protein [Candidatus Merdisoma sp. JLR.KK011]|uniref:VWA domain-containing protein n=1 Tax=Candidatus Merdisoma sp. JLR.KK011 TaxID=3114299 RepID=UPI002FEF47DC